MTVMLQPNSFFGYVIKTYQSISRSEIVRGMAQSLAVTGTAAVVSFAMLLIMARSMGDAEFGRTASWLNGLSFLAVVAVFGQEIMFVRSWNELVHRKRYDQANGLLRFGLAISVSGASILSIAVFGFALFFDRRADLAIALASFLFVQTLCLFTSQTARITRGIVPGVAHREITWRVLVIAGVAAASLLNLPFDKLTFFITAVVGLCFAVALQTRSTLISIPAEVKAAQPSFETAPWTKRSARMWVAGLIEAASQYLDVVLIAILLSPREAGIYFVASKLASLFLVLADALNLFSSRKIAFLYHKPDARALERTLKHVSMLTAIFVICGLLVMVGFGVHLLQIFGNSYADSKTILIILCAGTSAMALGGPSAQLLLLTGHEMVYVRTLAVVVVFRYLGIACLGLFAGLVGAAVANALAMIALSATLIFLCNKLLRLDPSALAILYSRPGEATASPPLPTRN
jgi:O-antigen/teichoic acid export membrane protein